MELNDNGSDQEVVKSKRGIRYRSNPFVDKAIKNTATGVKRIIDKTGSKMMVMSQETGELVGSAGFWKGEEVDKTQFVKLYVNGVRAISGLSAAGAKVFEILYLQIRENPGQDQVWLTFPLIDQAITPIAKATFYRGMSELIERKFIAESMATGRYFINPDYLWNGDRLSFVKEYRLRDGGRSVKRDDKTLDLFDRLSELK